MKKMIVFFIFIVLLFTISFFNSNSISFADCEKVVVISGERYDELTEDIIQNGKEFYHVLTGENIDFFKNSISKFNYKGLSLYFNKNHNLQHFNKVFSTTFSNKGKVDNYDIYYGYFNGYRDFKIIDGKRINMQLVKTESNWIVGFPMILTGF